MERYKFNEIHLGPLRKQFCLIEQMERDRRKKNMIKDVLIVISIFVFVFLIVKYWE